MKQFWYKLLRAMTYSSRKTVKATAEWRDRRGVTKALSKTVETDQKNVIIVLHTHNGDTVWVKVEL